MVGKTTSEEIVDQFMEHINAKDLDAATAMYSDVLKAKVSKNSIIQNMDLV